MVTIKIMKDEEWPTLLWLAHRGYDGNFWALSDIVDETDDYFSMSLTEKNLQKFIEYVEEDPDAFLACNGSEGLAKKLLGIYWGESLIN